MTWLEDVLAEVRLKEDVDLPHDLRSPDRCQSWAMRVLGQPRPGGDVVLSAARAFAAAIEKPLALKTTDGNPLFKWEISSNDATRLAEAFAEQRRNNPELPLMPQLQVVLARLLVESVEEKGGRWRIQVPEEPAALIRDALDAHLRRGLEEAFPATRDGQGRTARTRALLALRELCDSSGRRAQDVPEATMKAALGENGDQLLEKLIAPAVRLVVPQVHSDGTIWYSLPHDSLAELISRLFREDQRLKEYALDSKLVALWRLVTQRSEYFARTGDASALDLTQGQARGVRQNQTSLIWDSARTEWWKQASYRRLKRDRRNALVAALAFIGVLGAGAAAYQVRTQYRNDGEHQTVERVMSADQGVVLQSLSDLVTTYGYQPKQIVEILGKRTRNEALTALVDGPHRLAPALRLGTLLPVVRSLLDEYLPDPTAAGAMLAALDHYGRGDLGNTNLKAEALQLRDRIVDGLRKAHPVPPFQPDDWSMVAIPENTETHRYIEPEKFLQGTTHRQFRISRRGISNAQYLIFDPSLKPERYRYWNALGPGQYSPAPANEATDLAEYPAIVNWFGAYAYAAWMGARLPTYAQWAGTCIQAFPSAPTKPMKVMNGSNQCCPRKISLKLPGFASTLRI